MPCEHDERVAVLSVCPRPRPAQSGWAPGSSDLAWKLPLVEQLFGGGSLEAVLVAVRAAATEAQTGALHEGEAASSSGAASGPGASAEARAVFLRKTAAALQK